LEALSDSLFKAWEETFRNWDLSTKHMTAHTKSKLEDGQVEPFHRSVGKRRASQQSSGEHDPEETLEEWANMTGFLVALGGVCLQRKTPGKPAATSVGITPQNLELRRSTTLSASTQDVQYCPVTQ